ncbi:hypothetical protein M2271_001187 [Streptomyces sp. LBL]|uniref:DUF6508 domain-containing protein n=1 Tax=Streptomyces sp. LBL TaxID=2940562 RepID=UPI00247346A5|nr:DUF6508 domain-containing protein [Streptomyces sp. LBL]MDH6623400.1 hypothetical protein [Streptomyces sp. LBL]
MTNPVHYVTVTAPDGEVVGYAWGDAIEVEWMHRKASSPGAYEAGLEWYTKVREAHARGLTPLGVLNLLSREPGAGAVTEAPGVSALEDVSRVVTPADDRRLLAQLDRDDAQAWQELADAFDALTDEDRDVKWGGGQKSPSGAIHVAFPLYSEPLKRAVRALWDVGAVNPEHRWMHSPLPQAPPEGGLRPADAVRAATAVVSAERKSDGEIAQAVENGLLDAIATSLRAWYADPSAHHPAPEADPSAHHPAVDADPPAEQPSADVNPSRAVIAQLEALHPASPMCRFCGGSPAAEVTFRAHRGLVIFMGFKRMDGPMCFTCGLAVYRTLTTHTLCVGWWSPFSLFVFAPLTLVRNLLAVRRVRQLPAPGPGMLGPRYDPGVPIRRRPRAYVALVPVLWVVFMIVTGLTGGV